MAATETVLIIDDDPMIREIFEVIVEECLERLGRERYRIISTACSREAMEELERQRPAIIIQDLKRPGLDGRELLETLRKIYDKQTLPIIVVSGRLDSPDLEKEILDLGANAVVHKPDVSPLLEQTVKRLLGC
ncbi:response regulator [bacterium]|nr:response regulator [candidate division CSSED10-310 bacterium]